MRRNQLAKQGPGPIIDTGYTLTNSDTQTYNSRRRSLALGENIPPLISASEPFYSTPEKAKHRSLQGDDFRAALGAWGSSAPGSDGFSFEIYEKARGGLMRRYAHGEDGAGVAPSSVFGSAEPASKVPDRRRRRLSMGSQLEMIDSQSRHPTFTLPMNTDTDARKMAIRTAPTSRASSAPKVRPLDPQDPHHLSTVRALQFDRVSESLPNFKPSEVKPDFHNEVAARAPVCSFKDSSQNNVRPISKSESHTPNPQSPRHGKHSTPTKYLSARAVAERLAKAIRGGSKSSKNSKSGQLVPVSDGRESSSASDFSDGRVPEELYPRQFSSEQATDHSGIFGEFNEHSQLITSFRERKFENVVPREEKEIDMLKSWLEGLKRQSEGVHDDLEKKARAACERLEMLDNEEAKLDDQLLHLDVIQAKEVVDRSWKEELVVQQRLRKMHEEKKSLALEAASELRRRISERAAARKVFTLMKREMDAYAKVMENEKAEMQSNLEDEIARRESSWVVKLDKVRAEERGLREKVLSIEQENSYLQREMSAMASKDGVFREKVRGYEAEVDMYRTRTEQAEAEFDALQEACTKIEQENRALRKIGERLPQICGDCEKKMNTLQQRMKDGRFEDIRVGRKANKLQRELVRLSSLEIALRSEMQALKVDTLGYSDHSYGEMAAEEVEVKSSKEFRGELDRLQKKTVEMQDENNLLDVKLRIAVRDRDELKVALRKAEEEVLELRGVLGTAADQLEHGLHDFGKGESNDLEGDTDSQLTELEGRQGLQVSTRQLNAMYSRVEAMGEQLLERESEMLNMTHEYGKQEDAIRGLEHSLTAAGKTVEAQKARILRLSTRNEELVRLYHAKESEVQDLRILSSTEAESRKIGEQELVQLKEQALKCKQELRAQDLNCKLLKEELSTKEAELEQQNDNVVALDQRRDSLEAEVQKLQRLLGDANQKASSSEHQVEDCKEKIKTLQANVDEYVMELGTLRDQLCRVTKERDALSLEAEQMGREALKLSAEVEVLRRKVVELDEDVMVRDGQISILCNSLDDRE